MGPGKSDVTRFSPVISPAVANQPIIGVVAKCHNTVVQGATRRRATSLEDASTIHAPIGRHGDGHWTLSGDRRLERMGVVLGNLEVAIARGGNLVVRTCSVAAL